MGHTDLRRHRTVLSDLIVAEPQIRDVRDARRRRRRGRVLVHARDQAAQGSRTDLQHCVEVASQRIRHLEIL